jgi:Type I restriction modification DNA specificity domain
MRPAASRESFVVTQAARESFGWARGSAAGALPAWVPLYGRAKRHPKANLPCFDQPRSRRRQSRHESACALSRRPGALFTNHVPRADRFPSSRIGETGTTVQSLKYAEFEQQPFPLPPLAEQHRIVAKVDELIALCDQLEAALGMREAARDRLTAASLTRLNAPDPDTFPPMPGLRLRRCPPSLRAPTRSKRSARPFSTSLCAAGW